MLDHVQTVAQVPVSEPFGSHLGTMCVGFCAAFGDIDGSSKWEGKTMSTLRSLILVTLSTVVFSFLFELVWTVPGHAQQLPDQCLDNLPAPTPIAPSHRVVQLVNCSNSTI